MNQSGMWRDPLFAVGGSGHFAHAAYVSDLGETLLVRAHDFRRAVEATKRNTGKHPLVLFVKKKVEPFCFSVF